MLVKPTHAGTFAEVDRPIILSDIVPNRGRYIDPSGSLGDPGVDREWFRLVARLSGREALRPALCDDYLVLTPGQL
jgi:hypothetical protein